MHTYLWFIGDGNSSVYHVVVTGVPHNGHFVQNVECVNNAIKGNCLEALCRAIQKIENDMASPHIR